MKDIDTYYSPGPGFRSCSRSGRGLAGMPEAVSLGRPSAGASNDRSLSNLLLALAYPTSVSRACS